MGIKFGSHLGLRPSAPGLVRSPFVRADVTWLVRQLHRNALWEDRRPLRTFPLPVRNQLDADSPMLGMNSLGDDDLGLRCWVTADPNQTQVVSEINHLNNRSAHLDVENAASTVDRASYFCSFVFQEIGEQLKRTKLPVLELWDKLIVQSESAKPARALLASRAKRLQ